MNETEFAVIREINSNSRPNQREIAQKVGVSLGLVNLILRRFVQKGYIKIKEIPPRRVCYMLTPKGMAEKAKKSYDYTLRTLELLKSVTNGLQEIILEERQKGMKNLIITGSGELAALAEIAFRNLNLDGVGCSISKPLLEKNKVECCFMVVKNGTSRKVDIVAELSKRGIDY